MENYYFYLFEEDFDSIDYGEDRGAIAKAEINASLIIMPICSDSKRQSKIIAS